MRQRGFTIIELAIVMAVMAILLTLGTLGFRSYMAHARDKEREADILAIQNYLESIYPREIRDASGAVIKPAGTYPGHYVDTTCLPVGHGGGSSGHAHIGWHHCAGANSMSGTLFSIITKELPKSSQKGPLDNELFFAGEYPLRIGGQNLNSPAAISNIVGRSGISREIISNSRFQDRGNGGYVYFAHDGTVACKSKNGCRRYTLIYAPENGPWKMIESKHK